MVRKKQKKISCYQKCKTCSPWPRNLWNCGFVVWNKFAIVHQNDYIRFFFKLITKIVVFFSPLDLWPLQPDSEHSFLPVSFTLEVKYSSNWVMGSQIVLTMNFFPAVLEYSSNKIKKAQNEHLDNVCQNLRTLYLWIH